MRCVSIAIEVHLLHLLASCLVVRLKVPTKTAVLRMVGHSSSRTEVALEVCKVLGASPVPILTAPAA